MRSDTHVVRSRFGGHQRRRVKEIVAAIARFSGGKLYGGVRLGYVFYFAHLIYAKRRSEYLSTWPVICAWRGPGIFRVGMLIKELVSEGNLRPKKRNRRLCRWRYRSGRRRPWGFDESTIFVWSEAALPGILSSAEILAIHDAVKFTRGLTLRDLYNWIHTHSHSWRIAHIGDEMHIYIDRLSNADYDEKQSIKTRPEIPCRSECPLSRFGRTPHGQRRGYLSRSHVVLLSRIEKAPMYFVPYPAL